MQSLMAVSRELWYFVFTEHFGSRPQTIAATIDYSTAIEAAGDTARIAPEVTTAASIDFATLTPPTTLFVAIPDTPLHVFPTKIADGVIRHIPYGATVEFRGHQGQFIKVLYEEAIGWVDEGAVVLEAKQVTPTLEEGQYYDGSHNDTIAIRANIQDEFNLSALAEPLQDTEYVLYRQTLRNVQIPFSATRPRVAGSWQQLLKGQSGVHISVSPKTGAIFETIDDDEFGHVAFVEAVAPDQTITLATVGRVEPGIFERLTMPLSVWREQHPVFISLT